MTWSLPRYWGPFDAASGVPAPARCRLGGAALACLPYAERRTYAVPTPHSMLYDIPLLTSRCCRTSQALHEGRLPLAPCPGCGAAHYCSRHCQASRAYDRGWDGSGLAADRLAGVRAELSAAVCCAARAACSALADGALAPRRPRGGVRRCWPGRALLMAAAAPDSVSNSTGGARCHPWQQEGLWVWSAAAAAAAIRTRVRTVLIPRGPGGPVEGVSPVAQV
jgi:hypothetical protein